MKVLFLGLGAVSLLVGAVGVAGYAARQGIDRDAFVEALHPVLTAEQVGKAVLEIAADPAPAAEYQLSGAGLRTLT